MKSVTAEEFSLVTTGLGSVIALLLGLLVWFLRREIKQNDEAHKNLGQRIDRVEGKIDRLREDVGVLREDMGVLKGILIRHYGNPDHARQESAP
ncbi:MAG: hypothetical protein F4018_01470 [Acidobacteria bacterium]|nr:hypothetical protein [Acidobacteriota bacterium]MYK87113.1 hypothetical protein [Acidobacteriota bacterium]